MLPLPTLPDRSLRQDLPATANSYHQFASFFDTFTSTTVITSLLLLFPSGYWYQKPRSTRLSPQIPFMESSSNTATPSTSAPPATSIIYCWWLTPFCIEVSAMASIASAPDRVTVETPAKHNDDMDGHVDKSTSTLSKENGTTIKPKCRKRATKSSGLFGQWCF